MKNFWFVLYVAMIFGESWAFGAEVGMPQLNPEYWFSQIFWLILIFTTLYVIILKIFLPKITDSIENRKSKIVNDLHEAQKLKESAELKLKEYNIIVETSNKEAKKIIEDNKKILDSDIENKKKNFNLEIEKELLNAEREIEKLKKNSILNINKIAIEVSSEIIKELVKSEVNTSNVSAIVEEVSKNRIEKYL